MLQYTKAKLGHVKKSCTLRRSLDHFKPVYFIASQCNTDCTIFLYELFQFQEGLALKVFAIHVLNAPSIGQQILSFFKKFMKPKILDRLVLHSNLEELHKALPKECLPRDYGGEDYSMDELKGEPK